MRLDEIKALCDAATPGPWEHGSEEHVHDCYADCVVLLVGHNKSGNGAFIAVARTLLPALLEVAEEADKLLETAPTMEKRALRDALATIEALKLP